jgi:hypothetical protein
MKAPQPPKSYRGWTIERYSVAFQVLFRAKKGDDVITGQYAMSDLRHQINKRCEAKA